MKRSFALDGDSNVFLIKSLAGLPDSDESQWKAMIICKQMAFVAFSQLIGQWPSGVLCQCIFIITLSDMTSSTSQIDFLMLVFKFKSSVCLILCKILCKIYVKNKFKNK